MKMKKIALAVAAIAMVGCLASCKKTCTCTTYAAGIADATTEVDLEELQENDSSIKKCSDANTVVTVAGVKVGVECK